VKMCHPAVYKQEPRLEETRLVLGFGIVPFVRGPALAHGGAVATTAPPRRRGPGPRPSTSFSYKLRRTVPTNITSSPTADK
jgi:hypothetical protein